MASVDAHTAMKDAQVAALDFITAKESAENFRNPANVERCAKANIPTSVMTLRIKGDGSTKEGEEDTGLTPKEAQDALDAGAAVAQERLRLATQKLVLTELGEKGGADAIKKHTLNHLTRERMDQLLGEVAKSIGHEKPSLGQGVTG